MHFTNNCTRAVLVLSATPTVIIEMTLKHIQNYLYCNYCTFDINLCVDKINKYIFLYHKSFKQKFKCKLSGEGVGFRNGRYEENAYALKK